ncbi:MAG TPA: GTPase domain-containing protein [Polyangiaceae bacterium]|nr:GTPase domain-containing protein [Polyangiaceae bacterium]
MPVVNPLARELVFKIVYYGPGLGGKTTTLQHIHATTKAEHRGKMVSLATPVDRTLYFDFLPIRLPTARGMGVRLQLFTVPGQVYYNATRRLVLTGADGIVFVADSQRARLDANLESLANLGENLREHGRKLSDVPHAIAYNKRDLYDVVSIEELERQLDQFGAPSFATCATQGDGVYETLDAIARAVLDDFERRTPEGRELVASELQVPEGGLTEALRGVESHRSGWQQPPPAPRPRQPSGLLSLADVPRRASEPSRDVVPLKQVPLAVGRGSSAAPEAARLPSSIPPSAEPFAAPDSEPGLEPVLRERPVPRTGASFQVLWPEHERAQIVDIESAIRDGRFAEAVRLADELVSRTLAGVASALGSANDAPRDPALVVCLLGLEGRRYLEFRRLVKDARNGGELTEVEALTAFGFAIEARLARTRAS